MLTVALDIQTLARMTGKDFSGPTPQIHAEVPLALDEPQNSNNLGDPTVSADKQSHTPSVGGYGDDEEITEANPDDEYKDE